jgi:outer membrane protein assembly factor BamA
MASYEGQKVASLVLAGRPDLDLSRLEPLVQQKVGEPLSQTKIDQSVATLKAAWHLSDVTVDVRPTAEGLNVMMVLEPALYLGIYSFPGAELQFAYSRLLQAADYPVKAPYSIVDVEHAQEGLSSLFHRSGYFEATVRPEVKPDFEHGLVKVVFHVSLARRAKFGEVHLHGTSPEQTERLERSLGSFMARIRGASMKPGKTYSPRRLENATQHLRNALVKQHFLAAQVRVIDANYHPETNKADIDFNITTGPLVHVKVTGARVSGRTQRRLIPIFLEGSIREAVIEEGEQNLVSHFQSKGFFDAKVDTSVVKQGAGTTVTYSISRGDRRKVDQVRIRGNEHIPSGELMTHVVVKRRRLLFSHGAFSEQLVRRSVNNLTTVYRNAGYSQARVQSKVATEKNGNISVQFTVDEGPLDKANTFRIEGNESVDEAQLARGGLNIGPGKPFSQILVQQDRNQILATYLNLGYLNASFSSSAKPSVSHPHQFDVVYTITEGPRVQIARAITLGNSHTRQSLIDTTAKITAARPFNESELLASGSRLYTLDVFDWAEVGPRRPITTQSEEDVVLKLHESKRNSITYGFGFEVINRGGSVPSGTVAVPGIPPVGLPSNFKTSEKTFWGPRGSIEYTRRNMRGRAETLTAGGLVARLDQRGTLTYQIPSFRNSRWNVSLYTDGEHNGQNPIFTSRIVEGGLQFQRNLDAKGTKTVIFRYNLGRTTITDLLIPDLVPPSERNVRLSTILGNFIRDTRDNLLDAHKGIYQSAELSLNAKAIGSDVNFARFLGQMAYYRGIGGGIVWASSLRLGLQQPFANSRVPLSEKFFSGGGSTLRGFPLNGAGPQRTIAACGDPDDPSTCAPITVPVGGNQLFIVNTELRIPVPIKKGLGVAGFYDGGNVYQRVGVSDFLSNYTNSVGFGFRYQTPVGPIRLDIGHNLNSVPGIKATQVFVTLGQAF